MVCFLRTFLFGGGSPTALTEPKLLLMPFATGVDDDADADDDDDDGTDDSDDVAAECLLHALSTNVECWLKRRMREAFT